MGLIFKFNQYDKTNEDLRGLVRVLGHLCFVSKFLSQVVGSNEGDLLLWVDMIFIDVVSKVLATDIRGMVLGTLFLGHNVGLESAALDFLHLFLE